MKEVFSAPEFEVITIVSTDILVTSIGEGDENP